MDPEVWGVRHQMELSFWSDLMISLFINTVTIFGEIGPFLSLLFIVTFLAPLMSYFGWNLIGRRLININLLSNFGNVNHWYVDPKSLVAKLCLLLCYVLTIY